MAEKEYIEREAAIKSLFAKIDEPNHAEFLYCDEIYNVIQDIPAADVVDVRHGEWISVAADVLFRCSLCDCEVSTSWDYDQDGMFDYCPCCGAKMDGGADDGRNA